MAYTRNNLISRPGYSGVGGFMDTITGAAGSVLNFWNAQQQAAGAAAQSQRDLQAAMAAQGGIGTGTIVLLGGVGVVAYLLLRKRSA